MMKYGIVFAAVIAVAAVPLVGNVAPQIGTVKELAPGVYFHQGDGKKLADSAHSH